LARRQHIPAANLPPKSSPLLDKRDASTADGPVALDATSDIADIDWLVAYPARYEAESRNARKQRHEAREQRRRACASKPQKNLSPDQIVMLDWAITRATSRAATVDARWRHGHVWNGGAVGGDPNYYVPAQVYRGLVSDEHPVLQLFASKVPKSKHLLTGSTKSHVGLGDSKLLALDEAYVCANSQMRGILRVEIDVLFAGGFDAVADLCRGAGIPLPNIVIGHVDRQGALWRPHLLWLLADSVTFVGQGRRANRALWHRVLRGLTYALVPSGADAGGLANPLRVKNPLCPVWGRAVLAERPYSLADLKAHVRMEVSDADMAAARNPAHRAVDEPVPDPLAGSNAMFQALRDWARDHVATRQAAGVDIEEWRAELVIHALALAGRCRCSERHARSKGLRVANHVWRRPRRRKLSAEEIAACQREAAKKTHRGRRNATEAAVVAAYRHLLDRGGVAPTQVAVAAEIGKTPKTVRCYWVAAVEAAKQTMGTMLPPSLKKGAEQAASAGGDARIAPSQPESEAGQPSHRPSPPAFLVLVDSRPPPPIFLLRRPDTLPTPTVPPQAPCSAPPVVERRLTEPTSAARRAEAYQRHRLATMTTQIAAEHCVGPDGRPPLPAFAVALQRLKAAG